MIRPFSKPYTPSAISVFNINWANVEMEHADTWQEVNEILDILDAAGYEQVIPRKGCSLITICSQLANKYFLTFSKNNATLRWLEYNRSSGQMIPRQVDLGATELIAPQVTGYNSFYKVLNRFRKTYGINFDQMFGGGELNLWRQIRDCVPRPVNYADAVPRILDHVYKADISSCYGYESTKDLPTLIDCKKVRGFIAPSAEYPFVFYLKSHRLAIHNELDADEFKMYADFYNTSLMYEYPHQEISLCCKKASYSLLPIMSYYYEGRAKNPEYKQYMNLFVGYCYREVRPEYAHIAAVILARSAIRILRYARSIQQQGNLIRLIATDSVMWQGQPVDITTRKKTFGSFLQEYDDIRAVVMGAKKYQLEAPEGVVTRWSGVKRENIQDFALGDIIESKLTPLAYAWNGRRFESRELEDSENGD